MTKPQRYGASAAPREDGIFCLYAEYEKLAAECDRLRAALFNPIAMKVRWSPMSENMLSEFSQTLGEYALTRHESEAQSVTVYYGATLTFTSAAEFLAAHPMEQA